MDERVKMSYYYGTLSCFMFLFQGEVSQHSMVYGPSLIMRLMYVCSNHVHDPVNKKVMRTQVLRTACRISSKDCKTMVLTYRFDGD